MKDAVTSWLRVITDSRSGKFSFKRPWYAQQARAGFLDNRLAKFRGNALTPPIQ
jgi:hypothetical protein